MEQRRELEDPSYESPRPDEVFVIAGDNQRGGALVRTVARSGWTVKLLPSIDVTAHRCALVVLDCEQNVERGRTMCRTARHFVGHGRILSITRDRSSVCRAMLLESGADLVLSEPFAARELLACLYALARRSAGECDKPTVGNETRETEHDTLRRKPLIRGAPVNELANALQLTETERLLLEMLCTSKTPVATARLHEAVFSDVYYAPDSSHVRVHMHRLRMKLVPAGLSVEGLHGRGYRLIDRHDAEENPSPAMSG